MLARAGRPPWLVRYNYPRRYHVFFYCNTTAFGASLMVLILLLLRELTGKEVWLHALQFAMILGLLRLMGAYAAGSCREVITSVYIWVLLVGIFVYVILHVVFFKHLAPKKLERSCSLVLVLAEEEKRKKAQEVAKKREEEENLERNRSSLLVLATLVATVTYVAGLTPPGGFWSEGDNNHIAGDPVLRDHYPRRFKAFLICNATAFAGSLVIIIMVLSQTAVNHVVKSNALRLCVVVSLFELMGAYAVESCREVHASIYVFALVGAVLLYLIIQCIEPAMPKSAHVEDTIKRVKGKNKEMVQNLRTSISNLLEPAIPVQDQSDNSTPVTNGKDDFHKLRTYLLLLGILAATVTFHAGMNPPGGFWTYNSDGHIAGDRGVGDR